MKFFFALSRDYKEIFPCNSVSNYMYIYIYDLNLQDRLRGRKRIIMRKVHTYLP